MAFATGFAVYFIIWWVTLFAVLPWEAHSQVDEGDIVLGTEPGAPYKNPLIKKLLINTVVAGVVFGLFWWVTGPLGYSIDDIPSFFPEDIRVE